MSKRKTFFGKYGIKGNSGLTGNKEGIFHISANYDCNGKVFVDIEDWWERMTLTQAKRKKKHIITCALCKKAAVSLDHNYPYMSDMNRCVTHHGKDI